MEMCTNPDVVSSEWIIISRDFRKLTGRMSYIIRNLSVTCTALPPSKCVVEWW